MALEPDHDAALEFLRRWAPAGPWALTAIRVDPKAISTRVFMPDEGDACRAWLNEHHRTANLYFHVNAVRPDLTAKAAKLDVRAVLGFHVDVDPRAGGNLEAERARILHLLTEQRPNGVPAPTAIIFSGGGYQAFWRLREQINVAGDSTLVSQVEGINRGLEEAFMADSCHDISRLMRLPGTVNIPDAKKRKKGRESVLARVHSADWDLAYASCDFPPPVQTRGLAAQPEPLQGLGPRAIKEVNELDQWGVEDRVKIIIVQGHHPDQPKGSDNSRSAWLFDALCGMARRGVPDDVMLGVITDPDFGISASVIDRRSNVEKYALRQIARAKDRVAADAEDFIRDENGAIKAQVQQNIRVALRELGIELRFDEFANKLYVSGLGKLDGEATDEAFARLWLLIDEKYRFRPSREFFDTVVRDLGRQNAYDPVAEYLDGNSWDGTPRLDTWLITYGGAADSEYVRAVGALALVAAVRRIRQPGCKFDEMLVLESPQGTNKSSALQVLAIQEKWFSDDLPLDADTRRVIEALDGRWIVEAAELNNFKGKNVDHIKAFLSRQEDRARMAYGRQATVRPRRCIIVGTTNKEKYLHDETGNRRFWPVKVTGFDLNALKRDRDQIWAEAAVREAAGASIRLDPALYAVVAVAQEDRRVEDHGWADILAETFEGLNGKVLSEDIWTKVLDVPAKDRTQEKNLAFGQCLRKLGFQRTNKKFEGRNRNCYVRGKPEERERRIVFDAEGRAYSEDKCPPSAREVLQFQPDRRR